MWLRRTIAILLIALPPLLMLLPAASVSIRLELPPVGGAAPAAHAALPAMAQAVTYVGYGIAAALMILGVVLLVRSFVVAPPPRRPAAPYASLTARLLGRSRRREYWLSVVGFIVAATTMNGLFQGSWVVVAVVIPIWLLIALRRLHGFGASGWWAWVIPGFDAVQWAVRTMLPILYRSIEAASILTTLVVTLGYVLIVGIIPGTRGPNRFGPAPGEAAFDAEVFD